MHPHRPARGQPCGKCLCRRTAASEPREVALQRQDSRVPHLTDALNEALTRSLPGYGTDYSDLYNLFEYGSDW